MKSKTSGIEPLRSRRTGINQGAGWLRPTESVSLELYNRSRKRLSNLQRFWSQLGGGLELIDSDEPHESKVLLAVTILACFVRCWAIWRPKSIVFDEVHFGGFASKYIQSAFFMDVHPPLAKLLITLVAFLNGYDGHFEFKDIAYDYLPDRVPYVQMRLLPALLGVALVPLSYLTMRMLTLRPHSALLGALFITFENGLIVQSRFILLDSPLLFFTALSTFFYTGFCNEDASRSFTRRWWIWLTLTGLALGAVVSSKWVGLFTIATIGVLTVKQLWELLGDLRVPLPLLARSLVARFVCLAILPVLFYMFIFQIHFWILSASGDGDAFMSSEFQHTLRGHWMPDTYADVLIGSNVTIKHINTLGGYLHSHPFNYPTGSKQQQITLYPHSDENNLWTILGRLEDESGPPPIRKPAGYYERNRFNVNGSSIIRLQHALTQKRLHSHELKAPVTEVDYQSEVSGYGFLNFPGDANDEWIIEIVSKESDTKLDPISSKRLRSIRTKFRLRHPLQNCYLFSHKIRLPEWGFGQQEVTCNRNPTMANSLWYIESSTHPLLRSDPKALKVNYYRPSFLSKFWELQRVMWQTNQGLVDRHSYDSRPLSWPLLSRGINFWVKNHRQIYLLGNPFVWWLSTASVGVYLMMKVLLILISKRGYNYKIKKPLILKYDGIAGYLTLGWMAHYLPFFLMSRQLFLHHYFPALYHSIFLTCTIFDLSTTKLNQLGKRRAICFLVFMTCWTWSECERVRWRRSWDFSCYEFLERREDYDDESYDGFKIWKGGKRIGSKIDQGPSQVPVGMLEPIQNVFEKDRPINHAAEESIVRKIV
ncbi:dolichyl-phosphate-mannose-protein mannosyltransferase [Phakopsora pachyrhizi]|uniref:Dolichyl-phosphate-mannose--protein mannosyltransferase n=1 Tax=Phakopsora pachyrhizi TaxID=170000 RepID=A0AAV0APX6_PHAPC|nr:dolichyl-phosphate-mannose-protein mannosyltransferase [Phakopsora pachyrhizi]